jgi:hypothetical protein
MATKSKPKSAPARSRAAAKEEAVFLAGLECHGQVQKNKGPLKAGVTHVLEPAGDKGKLKPVRKRFSAI